MAVLVRGGTVVTADGEARADVLCEGETILAVASDIDAPGAQIVDAGGCYVMPGFNAMNPDAFIARKNIAREGHLDTWYLRELSADAAGVLRQIPEERLDQYDRTYFATYRSAPENVSSFNLARACDRAGGAPLHSFLCP